MKTRQALTVGHKALAQFMVIAFPILTMLVNARLVMTPLFLQIEYNRAGFPADVYGFSIGERLEYAPYALNYLLNGAGIDYLGDLRFATGAALFNARELHHMRDVKAVTQAAFGTALVIGVLFIISMLMLWRSDRQHLWAALTRGAWLTISLIVLIVVLAVISWNVFFTLFHSLFFASGTWQFAYSDTLIRLFPEQFWFDAALVIGGLCVVESMGVIALMRGLGRFDRPKS